MDYSQIALQVYLLLYILMFVLPVVILKRKGIDAKGTLEGIPKWPLFAYFILFISFLWLPLIILYVVNIESISWFLKISFLANDMVKITGITIIGIGLLIEAHGMIEMGENFRIYLPREKTKLITTGIYRYIRNPLVLSIYMLVFGAFLIIPNLLMLLVFICNIYVYQRKIREEEEYYLLKVYKKEYEEYKKNVGGFFPKLKRGDKL